MEKRLTMKDIALAAGVSPATVHIALSGKPGIREETRQRIRELAAGSGYRVNNAAAALSRKALRVAALIPQPTGENRYYYTYMWEAVREFAALASDWNIELVDVPYVPGETIGSLNRRLAQLLGQGIDGLLTLAHTYGSGEIDIRPFAAQGVPVVLLNSDLPDAGRLCCVMPDYGMIGRTMGELTARLLPPQAKLLLCGEDPQMPPHTLVEQAYAAYLGQYAPGMRLVYLPDEAESREENLRRIAQALRAGAFDGCVAVSARCTAQLGTVLQQTGLAGKVMALGCDLFPESLQLLKAGVYTCLIHKKPYEQAYYGMKYLVDYLVEGTAPAHRVISPGAEVVFRTNCAQFDNPGCRLVL